MYYIHEHKSHDVKVDLFCTLIADVEIEHKQRFRF